MKYRTVIHCLQLLSLALLTSAANKNVLLIVVDDLRPDLNFYSQLGVRTNDVKTTFKTDNMDALAADSLIMTRAYAQVALCGPSRSSFLTSRYPDTIGVRSNNEEFRDTFPTLTTLPGYFLNLGYDVRGMGKVFHKDAPETRTGLSWSSFSGTSSLQSTTDSWKNVSDTDRAANPLMDDMARDLALAALDDMSAAALAGTKNFFLTVGFKKPHLPWIFPDQYMSNYPEDVELPPNSSPPTNFRDIAWSRCSSLCTLDDIQADQVDCSSFSGTPMTDDTTRKLRRAYYSSVSYIDDLVGDVLNKLSNLGLAQDTVVMLMSDHGWHLREHNSWCKTTLFEDALRIPLIMRIPGQTDGSIVSHNLAEALDVYPTLVEAATGGTVPDCAAGMVDACTEGRSLMPLINDPATTNWRTEAFSQVQRSGRGINGAFSNTMGYSMRTDDKRFNVYPEFDDVTWSPNWLSNSRQYENRGISEMYNMASDPWQTVNLINPNDNVNDLDTSYVDIVKARFP